MASYVALSEMHPDKNAQGATQTVSALRYFFALDQFYKSQGRDCDTRNREDKNKFNQYVGNFCYICDKERTYTAQFYLPLKEHNGDYNIGSNFYSVGQVKLSLNNGGMVLDYPQRGNAPLFNIKEGVLLRNLHYYPNLLHYLPSDKIRLALALWVCRYINLDIDKSDMSGANLYHGIKGGLLKRYSTELVDELLPGEEESAPILETLPISFTEKQGYVFSGKEIEALFPEFGNSLASPYPKAIDLRNKPIDANYSTYLAAMRTKPFLLLAGISGTGKSRIVKEMAFASCPPSLQDEKEVTPGNYCMIEVKPNWHDSTDLLGYFSSIQQQYVVTPFINFLIKAWINPKAPFFVCLDEMNLAPVEQYFAEFLSVLESRKLKDGTIVSDALIKREIFCTHIDDFKRSYYGVKPEKSNPIYESIEKGDSGIWASFTENGITLPQNLIVVGTVNMDDTTCQFSRKVIDRAMTIEMNKVDFHSMLDLEKSDTLKYPVNYVGAEFFIPKFAAARDAYLTLKSEDQLLLYNEAISMLEGIDSILTGTPFRIAYRVENELLLYFCALREEMPEADGKSLLNNAFDDILMMKILPRIQGSDELKDTLDQLYSWTETSFPKANAKVHEMRQGLEQKHFTSFWP